MLQKKDGYDVNGTVEEKKAALALYEEDDADVPPKPTSLLCSKRLILAIIGFFMFFHLYAQRIGMSVAIVCMVNHTAVLDLAVSKQEAIQGASDNSSASFDPDRNMSYVAGGGVPVGPVCSRQLANSTQKDGPFVWEKDIQGHILGAFFYGYLVSQIPGGLLAERYGGKWVLTAALGLSSLATLLTPLAAQIHWVVLIILRVLVGIGSGALYPAMHAMLGQWAPPLERSKLCGITYAGSMMGNVIALPVSGLLCQYGFSGGWDSVFYVIGISSIVTIVLWAFLTSNTPASHPTISAEEKRYIMHSLKGEVSDEKVSLCSVPWKSFFTSGPVWALIIANFCTDWGLYTYLTNIPTFYKEVLYFDIQSNGLYSALPFLGLWAIMNIAPACADKLQSSKILSTVQTRKLFNTIGLIGPAVFLIGLSFIDCSKTGLAVAILILAVTVAGFVYSGYFVNHMDIAPQYAGTLMGVANGISASAGFIAPYVASVVTRPQTRESWQIVFFIAAAVYTIGAVAYIILASGTLQPWAQTGKLDNTANDIELKNGDITDKDGYPGGVESDRKIYNPPRETAPIPIVAVANGRGTAEISEPEMSPMLEKNNV